MPDAPSAGIEGENSGIGGIGKRRQWGASFEVLGSCSDRKYSVGYFEIETDFRNWRNEREPGRSDAFSNDSAARRIEGGCGYGHTTQRGGTGGEYEIRG